MLEVELKASLAGISPEKIEAAAREMGFLPRNMLRETDIYWNSSARDFRKTDEALRLRRCQDLNSGDVQTFVTYKGPKLDRISNTRTEYETAVGDAEVMGSLLEALGYLPVFTVDKVRRELWREGTTLCLDKVEGLGDFLEIEVLAEQEQERAAAVERLLSLLDALGVPRDALTGRSYLEMLMSRR